MKEYKTTVGVQQINITEIPKDEDGQGDNISIVGTEFKSQNHYNTVAISLGKQPRVLLNGVDTADKFAVMKILDTVLDTKLFKDLENLEAQAYSWKLKHDALIDGLGELGETIAILRGENVQ